MHGMEWHGMAWMMDNLKRQQQDSNGAGDRCFAMAKMGRGNADVQSLFLYLFSFFPSSSLHVQFLWLVAKLN